MKESPRWRSGLTSSGAQRAPVSVLVVAALVPPGGLAVELVRVEAAVLELLSQGAGGLIAVVRILARF